MKILQSYARLKRISTARCVFDKSYMIAIQLIFGLTHLLDHYVDKSLGSASSRLLL